MADRPEKIVESELRADEPKGVDGRPQPFTTSNNSNGDLAEVAGGGPNGTPSESEAEKTQDGATPVGQPAQHAGEQKKKSSKFGQWREKAGLDEMTLKMMLKGSIPPIVALAMYQSDAVAAHYSTLG